MKTVNNFKWIENGYDVSLEQVESGVYVAEVRDLVEGFIGGIVCPTANEAHRFVDEITAVR